MVCELLLSRLSWHGTQSALGMACTWWCDAARGYCWSHAPYSCCYQVLQLRPEELERGISCAASTQHGLPEKLKPTCALLPLWCCRHTMLQPSTT